MIRWKNITNEVDVMRYGIALIFLILSMSTFAFSTTEPPEASRHENVVSINNPQDFISSMGNPSKYTKLKNKQEILAKLDQLIQNPNDPTNQGLIAAYNLLEQTPHLSPQKKASGSNNIRLHCQAHSYY